MKNKLQTYISIVALSLLLSGALIWNVATGEKAEQASVAAEQTAQTAPVQVNVATVATADIPDEVTALATLTAVQKVTLSAESDGKINKIYFNNGQEVAESMPILQEDDAQARADYQTAVTDLQLARKKYERDLQVGDAISKQDLEQAKADVESKEADVKSKQAILAQKQVIAPFEGVLGDFKFNEGDYVKAGDPIVSLVNTKQLRANYSLPQNYIPQLQRAQLVKISVAAYPKKIFYGTVSFISPTVDPDTRSVAVQALVPNPEGLLSPGMFVHVAQQIGLEKNALVIPEQAIQTDLKGSYVYQVKQGRALQTYLTLGAHANGNVQVLSGLSKDSVVVIAGQQKLEDGVAVQAVGNNLVDIPKHN